MESIGMSILEDHLVPELKSTALAHDRTCFAIQTILKELNRCELLSTSENVVDTSRVDTITTSSSTATLSSSSVSSTETNINDNLAYSHKLPSVPKGITPTPMTESLKAKLSHRLILDIIEPFWVTSYTMRSLDPVLESPIYKPESTFVQWLGRWARKLGEWGPVINKLYNFYYHVLAFTAPIISESPHTPNTSMILSH